MKFTKEKYAKLDGNVACVYTPEGHDFVIEATRYGVRIKGDFVMSEVEDFQDVAQTIGLASRDFIALRPKLTTLAEEGATVKSVLN